MGSPVFGAGTEMFSSLGECVDDTITLGSTIGRLISCISHFVTRGSFLARWYMIGFVESYFSVSDTAPFNPVFNTSK